MCKPIAPLRPLDEHSRGVCSKAVKEWQSIVSAKREGDAHRVSHRFCSPKAAGGGLLAAMLNRSAQPCGEVHQDLLAESMELNIVLTIEQPIEGVHARYHSETYHTGSHGSLASNSAQMRLAVRILKSQRTDYKLLLLRLWRRESLLRNLLMYEAREGRSLSVEFVIHAPLWEIKKAIHHHTRRQMS